MMKLKPGISLVWLLEDVSPQIKRGVKLYEGPVNFDSRDDMHYLRVKDHRSSNTFCCHVSTFRELTSTEILLYTREHDVYQN